MSTSPSCSKPHQECPKPGSAPTHATVRLTQPAGRRGKRGAAMALLAATVVVAAPLMAGCGGGLGFTGGSIPIGKAVILGKVVRAEQASLPLEGATITAVAKTAEGKTTVLQVISNAGGTFMLTNVPTGATLSQVDIDVSPSQDSARYSQHFQFQISDGGAANLIAALPTLDAGVYDAATLSITAVSRAPLGQRIHIYSSVRDHREIPLHLVPSVLYIGNNAILDTMEPDNSKPNNFGVESRIYLDTRTVGSGSVTAFLFNGLHSTPVIITADPQAPPVPAGN